MIKSDSLLQKRLKKIIHKGAKTPLRDCLGRGGSSPRAARQARQLSWDLRGRAQILACKHPLRCLGCYPHPMVTLLAH